MFSNIYLMIFLLSIFFSISLVWNFYYSILVLLFPNISSSCLIFFCYSTFIRFSLPSETLFFFHLYPWLFLKRVLEYAIFGVWAACFLPLQSWGPFIFWTLSFLFSLGCEHLASSAFTLNWIFMYLISFLTHMTQATTIIIFQTYLSF